MKRRLTVISLIIICLAVCAFSTAAYYTASEPVHNVLTTGDLNLQLVPNQSVTGSAPGTTIMPGHGKSIDVQMTADEDVYLRFKAVATVTAADGTALDASLVTLSWPGDAAAIQNVQGWTHYVQNKGILKAGTAYDNICTVSLASAAPNSYQGATIQVKMIVQAIQAEHNTITISSGSSPAELAGLDWPAEPTT